jgi:hypothetical protein
MMAQSCLRLVEHAAPDNEVASHRADCGSVRLRRHTETGPRSFTWQQLYVTGNGQWLSFLPTEVTARRKPCQEPCARRHAGS